MRAIFFIHDNNNFLVTKNKKLPEMEIDDNKSVFNELKKKYYTCDDSLEMYSVGKHDVFLYIINIKNLESELHCFNNLYLTNINNILEYKIIEKESTNQKYIQKILDKISSQDLVNIISLKKSEKSEKKNDIIKFYSDEISITDYKNFKFDNVILLSDKNFDEIHDFIQWLFPSFKKSGHNENAPILTDSDVKVFKTNDKIRNNVQIAVNRMFEFFGFILKIDDNGKLNAIKKKDSVYIYSTHNYKRITRMLEFLNIIDFTNLSILFYKTMIDLREHDSKFKRLTDAALKNHWNKIMKPLLTPSPKVMVETIDLTRDDESKENQGNCQFNILRNIKNSCYQDAVLFSLFAVPTNDIMDNILNKDVEEINRKEIIPEMKELQTELRRIYKSIHRIGESVDYCTNLRKIIKKILEKIDGYESFWDGGMKDSAEFLIFLLTIFEMDTMIQTEMIYPYKKSLNKTLPQYTRNVNKTIPIIKIPKEYIKNIREKTTLSPFVVDVTIAEVSGLKPIVENDEVFESRKIITKYNLEEINYVIFYIPRLIIEGGDEILLDKQIIPNERIGRLKLFSVVVYNSRHYTSYLLCNGNWHYYDDMSGIKKLGSFEEALKHSPSLSRGGVLYFYARPV